MSHGTKPRFIARGPRASASPDDTLLWFLFDTHNGVPHATIDGIVWLGRSEAKAKAAALNETPLPLAGEGKDPNPAPAVSA